MVNILALSTVDCVVNVLPGCLAPRLSSAFTFLVMNTRLPPSAVTYVQNLHAGWPSAEVFAACSCATFWMRQRQRGMTQQSAFVAARSSQFAVSGPLLAL